MKKKVLIIGSGFFGSVLAERLASQNNFKVEILEKRNHFGGNSYSEIDKKTNIEYHKYGTHIFHTSNKEVMNYMNKFMTLNNYKHQVFSSYKNKIYTMPFNLFTINQVYNKNFSPSEAKDFIGKQINKIPKDQIFSIEDKAITSVGPKIYKLLIKGYTMKQWGKHPKYLPQHIINRIPLRFNFDNNYFLNSQWQGIPQNGYADVFKKMLKHKNINIKYNQEFSLKNLKKDVLTIYTGPLDKLFDYEYGKLEWRSLKFKKKHLNKKDFQGNSVINYPDFKVPYTRIHEPKHLHNDRKAFNDKKTLIIYEYSNGQSNDPYYPVNDKLNRAIHRKYKDLLTQYPNLFIGGRLADYAYYDMDMTISAALKLYHRLVRQFSL